MKVADYVSKAQVAKKSTSELFQSIDKLGKDSPEKFNTLAAGAAGFGTALLALPAIAVKLSSEFEKAMSAVSAATHASAQDLGRLRDAAMKAGADTQFSATEAAQGITELSKAGVSTQAVLAGGLKGALDLAAAGQLDVAEAAETAASAMTQFQLDGSQIPHLADLLAAGAGKAQGSVHDLGMALNMSGLVASQFGLSVEDTIGGLAAFASAGLTGSDAGTSFKQMLLMLAAPSGVTASLMEELGIAAYDAGGNFIGLTNLAQMLQDKLGGLTQEARQNALAQIFGSDAIRGASILYQQGAAGIQDWIDKTNDAGYAADTAARLTDNLSGDVERLTGSLETLAIGAGSGSNSALRTLTKSAGALVDQVSLLPAGFQSTVVLMAGLGGAALLGVAGFAKMRQKSAELTQTLADMGPAGAKAGRGLESVTKWGGRAAAVFATLEIASAVTSSFTHDLNPQVGALSKGLAEFAKNGKTAGEAARILGEDGKNLDDIFQTIDSGFWTDLGNGIAGFVEGIVPGASSADSSLTKIKERISAIDAGLTQLVSSGRADDAAAAFQKLADEGAKHGISVQELKNALPQYAATLDKTTDKLDLNTIATQQAATKGKALAQSWEDQITAGNKLSDLFDTLNGGALDLAAAEDSLYAAIDDASAAYEENGKTFDVHTEKGRANRKALEDLAKQTRDVIQAMQDSGAPLTVMNAKYKEAREAFIGLAFSMTGSAAKAKALADAWLAMPADVNTVVQTPGLTTAQARLKKVEDTLARIDGSRATAQVTLLIQELHREEARQYRRWGGVTEHAAEGTLRDAAVYSPQAPARYAFAEPATGGEAFVPKHGPYGRAMSILSTAASWYGAAVMPGNFGVRAGGTATVVHEHRYTLTVDGSGVLAGLRQEIKFLGGDVQASLGTRIRTGS